MKPLPLSHECGAHEHESCNHVITAALNGNKVLRNYCQCPCHEVRLLKAQNALMKESLRALHSLKT